MTSAGNSISHLCEAYFAEHGAPLNVVGRSRPASILGAVEAGRGIALATKLQARFFDIRHVRMLPLRPPLMAPLGILVRSDHQNDAVFLDLVRQISYCSHLRCSSNSMCAIRCTAARYART